MIFDTSVIVDFIRDKEKAKKFLEKFGDVPITITSITAYELLRRAFKKLLKDGSRRELYVVTNIIKRSIIYDFDVNATKIASKIHSVLEREEEIVNEVDILVAGIVMANNEELVTKDKDFLIISKYFPEFSVIYLE